MVEAANHRSGVLSTSAAARSADAVGVPAVPLATPPSSITVPVAVPVIVAASLRPVMLIVTSLVPIAGVGLLSDAVSL